MRSYAYLVPLLTALFAACEPAETSPVGDGTTAAAPTDPRVSRADSARIKGAPDAPIWIVEVSDFQCPFCRQWQQQTYPQLQREYIATGKARLAYIHLPISSHRHALRAAEASMCAGAQNRFWELHDAIFETQPQWAGLSDATSFFDSLATAAGVDAAAYRACVRSGIMRESVRADYQRAVSSGATSTPTFLIMGDSTVPATRPTMLVGAQPIENFRTTIDTLLARRSAARGQPR